MPTSARSGRTDDGALALLRLVRVRLLVLALRDVRRKLGRSSDTIELIILTLQGKKPISGTILTGDSYNNSGFLAFS
jgi:hypothetical protein